MTGVTLSVGPLMTVFHNGLLCNNRPHEETASLEASLEPGQMYFTEFVLR